LLQDKNRDILDKFLDGEGPPKFFAYYQTPDTGG
jgi:dynein heavy chain